MATAKRRGIDALRRRVTLERKQELIGRELQILQQLDQPDLAAQVDDVRGRRPAPDLHDLPPGPVRGRRASR